MKPNTDRLHGLDFLRALMMSLGIVLHSAQMYLTMPLVDYYWDSARSPSMDALLIFINTFRMPVFYLLSGFFAALLLHRKGTTAMFENRYKRIVIPFLLFLPVLALSMSLLRVVAQHVMATGGIGFDLSLVDHPRLLWDNTHNLWFLYYLIFHLGTAWLLLKIWPSLPISVREWLSNLVQRKPIYSGAVFIIVCLGLSAIGSLNSAGRISANLSFIPDVRVYLYFGLCFLLGWVLYQRVQDLEALAARWKKSISIATALFVIALALFVSKGEIANTIYYIQHALLSLATGFCVGFYMLGFVGMFRYYFQTYNPWIRYFSDSAYWIFIFHSIPLVIIGLLLHDWNVAAEIKFLMVCVGTLLACLSTYQLFIRNGRIGEVLNGQRYNSKPWENS